MAPRQPRPYRSLLLLCAAMAGCASPTLERPSDGHLQLAAQRRPDTSLPEPVTLSALPSPPRQRSGGETYSVVVNQVPVHDLLFALARDASINVDIHPGIAGKVTLNAVDQTLPQLLARIARQVDMRYEHDGPNLAVMPDTPYLRSYAVDYVNMSRDTSGSVAVTTQLAGPVAATGASAAALPPGGHGNNSMTRIENKAQHRFWETLLQNVKDLLRETDRILPAGSSETVVEQAALQKTTGTGAPAKTGNRGGGPLTPSLADSPNPASLQNNGTTIVRRSTFREAAAVIAHPETGTLSVRATSRQHERVREFLDRVESSARRQVMIEATLVEVQLSRNYQQGIDWSRIAGNTGFSVSLTSTAGSLPGQFAIGYANGSFSSVIRLLDTFGTTKVLSSPKLSVLNNQTAVIKVVDNSVYFTIRADTSQNQTTTVTTYTTTLNQVPVGFVMNVTPQISDADSVLLNVRPSVSRIIGTVRDPNPALRKSTANAFAEDIVSEVPVIRTREMESMLRVRDGAVAVMGGLMEDAVDNRDRSLPGAGQLPLLGELFTQRDDSTTKSELVVFLKPTIIRDPSLAGDYAALNNALPAPDFFTDIPDPRRPRGETGRRSEAP